MLDECASVTAIVLARDEERTEEPSAKKRRRYLTDATWAEIEELYELGRVTAAELSAKYYVSPQALSKRFKAKGIVKGSKTEAVKKAVEETTIAKTAEEIVTFELKRLERIEQAKEQAHGDAILMRNMALKKIQDLLKPGGTPLLIKEMVNIQAILEQSRRARYAVLEIGRDDGEGELPVLPIQQMTEEEIRQKREQQEENDTADKKAPPKSPSNSIG